MRVRRFAAALAVTFILVFASAANADDGRLLVILTETGRQHDGLPVLRHHPDPARFTRILSRGFSGRLLRLYRDEQRYLARRTGQPVEPAYLLLSSTEGGFPRFGFYLQHPDGREEAKPTVGYVDLHRNSTPAGRFGAMDQIFPHELTHVIVRQLAGEPPEGGSNQVHAFGVRTDPITAFNEGFAEHAQVMALDDDDASAELRRLREDVGAKTRALASFEAYRRAMTARWSLAPKARMIFPFWFSQQEQVLRYFGSKENDFLREPDIPERLFRSADPYPAYLLANTLPGVADGALKRPGTLLSTEAVVSALFVRWVTSPAIQQRRRDPAFYAQFAREAADVTPLDNAYLKLFDALARARPHDAVGVIRGYIDAFPEERSSVEPIVRDCLGGQMPQAAPEIWLANKALTTGTTLFDQFRALPRVHTFDLNAASRVDLASVPGMTSTAAAEILARVPYAGIADLRRLSNVSPALVEQLKTMEKEMVRMRAEAIEETATLSLRSILMAYAKRAAAWLALAALAAAALYRTARRVAVWRLALNGLVAAAVGLLAGWSIDPGHGLFALAAPVLLFGIPAASGSLMRRRSGARALRCLAAWFLAALAPFAIVRPWG